LFSETPMPQTPKTLPLLALTTALAAAGCPSPSTNTDSGMSPGDGGTLVDTGSPSEDAGIADDAGPVTTPPTYAFDSRFAPGTSSVSYGGQTARNVLIRDLSTTVVGLTDLIDRGTITPADGEIVAALDLYFGPDAASRAGEPILLTTDPDPLQAMHGDLSETATLIDKLAGNDASTDYVEFSGTAFRGWSDESFAANGGSIETPTGLVRAMFETIEANAIARGEGTMRLGPGGEDLPVHVTETGIDLDELSNKFLLVAVAYHQSADDYLDDQPEDPGKGLLADNTMPVMGQPYTELEHAWDEGFGYFGASRDAATYTSDELTDGTPWRDSNGDGRIDLRSEMTFSQPVYLARRDLASDAAAPTTFFAQAERAFREGRAIITRADGALEPAELDALRAQRDLVLEAWDAGLAATLIHYLNRTLLETSQIGTADYAFLEHAKVWSEMKAFALGLQFNRFSPVLARFDELHTLLGDRPVLGTAPETDRMAYMQRLRDARALLASVYGFDAANLGDDVGLGGW
jgi:hypothetical protein